ncbi:MAG: two-component regulator propeller domain-containing protein [Saprospiraceae bacterium]
MKSICLSMMLFMHLYVAHSQFSIINYNTSNSGLPNNNLFCVTIDKDDNAWFGAYDYPEGNGGIIRFDGISWSDFKILQDTMHTHINNISKILFASNKDMWVYSYSNQGCRITKWDSVGYVDVTPSENLFGTGGLSFNQSIFFIDWWTGLYEYNYDSLKWIFHNNFPVEADYNPISSFNIDSAGTYWIGIGNRNMFLYKDTILSKIELFPELPPKFKSFYYFNSTAFAKDGSVWFGTNVGLVHWFEQDNFVIYDVNNSALPGDYIDNVLIDQRGYVWITMAEKGLALWNGDNFIIYDKDNSVIGSNEIRDIAEDNNGNIWIATWGGGVSKFTYDPTSVDYPQSNQLALDVFPNPVKVNGELTICLDTSHDFKSFSLWSIDGVLIHQYELEKTTNLYSIKDMGITSGLYLGMATDEKGNQFTTKIVVVD